MQQNLSYSGAIVPATPQARLDELAEILARGYLRMLAVKEKQEKSIRFEDESESSLETT